MGAKAFALHEAKYLFIGTTYSSTYVDADHADFAHDGTDCFKARFQPEPLDLSGLTYPRLPDPSARTRLRGRAQGILGLRTGGFSISHYLNSSTADDFILTLLGYVLGGSSTPSADSDIVDAGSSTTVLEIDGVVAATGVAAGHALLCGVKGDGRGNGEVIGVDSVTADTINLSRATKTAMESADVIWVSHTVYPDPDAAVEIWNMLLTGADAASPDQYNLVGCQSRGLTFGNLGVSDGELPIFTLDIGCGDWRLEPIGSVRAMEHTVAPLGANPALPKEQGGLWVTDSSALAARGYFLGGNYTIDPDHTMVPLIDPQHSNQIGGWKKVMGNAKWSWVGYSDEGSPDQPVPDLSTGFETDGHELQLMYQFGNAADSCFAIDISQGLIDEQLKRTELNSCAAWTVSGHAEEGATTTDLLAADFKIHFFHT